MDISSHVRALNARLININTQQRNYIDECHHRHPGDTFTSEELRVIQRQDEEIADIERERAQFVDRERRESDHAQGRAAFDRTYGGFASQRADQEQDLIRRFLLGDPTAGEPDPENMSKRVLRIPIGVALRERELIRQGVDPLEARSILWDGGASGGSMVVPTRMSQTLAEYFEASSAMLRMPVTRIPTNNGQNLVVPRLTTHSIGTQVIAQGTAIAGSDPVFGNMTLNAYKYGQLVQVSSEMIQDAAFDIGQFLARDVGRGLGRLVSADLVVGTGTNEPNGAMTAITQTANTGGSLINPTYESLIDLQHAVVDEYRNSNSAWLMRDATTAVIRKIRDGAGGTLGAPIWQPSINMGIAVGQPDMLLGYPVYTDPNVASIASNAAIIAYGDWNAYYVRTVGDILFERSDDFAFNTDLVTFRGKWRVDGDLSDALALAKQRVNV